MPIQWREKLSVGHTQIDDDHKQLLCLLNGVEVLVRRCVAKDAILAFLDEIDDYTQLHFQREEGLMSRSHYPETHFLNHQKRHQELIRELQQIRRGIDEANDRELLTRRVLELMETLKHWLIEHIIKEDRHYTEYLQQR